MRIRAGWWIAFLLLGPGSAARASQPLETETARTPRVGEFQIDATFERQTSQDGREVATPLAVEYGVTSRLELLVEPVVYTSIRPKVGPGANGVGDLEVTITGLARSETRSVPALAAAFEMKVPTSRDPLIGTGKADYAGYLIASKRLGRADVHADFGYSVLGRPAGLRLNNVLNYAAAVEYACSSRLDLVAEALNNTAALPEGNSESGTGVTQEVTGAETVGMVGARVHANGGITFALGVSYDNNQAWLIRPGITLRLR